MEPPVASSGPMLRRAATFSHRTERALKDVNGRVGLVNKSQEHLLTSKTTVDAPKVTRPTKQYSAVASRYAAPLLSKKQPSTAADVAHGGHANVTKLPFSTGRSAPHHQRRPSSDNPSSFQPPMVFAATSRDARPDTLAKKAEVNGNSFGAKRPRVGVRASMIEKKSQAQTRAPRFLSLDKGGCSCSKNSLVRGSVDASVAGSGSLLYSAGHWLSLIKLAEGEKKHEVVIDLFRLAITLKAEPTDDVVVQLKRYQESCPSDKVVNELVQQCEGTQREACSTNSEVIDKAVCEPEDSKNAASLSPNVASVNMVTIVPPVVSENEALVKKDEPPAKKAPHFMGRMLSRSSTFSVVDAKSQSQHAKAEYGKKLAKTLEFLATQAAAHSPSNTGVFADPFLPEAETIGQSPTTLQVRGQCEVEPSEKLSTSLQSQRLVSDNQSTPGFKIASKILEIASKVGSGSVAGSASENFSCPVSEAGSTRVSGLGNGSAEKPVESLSKWLDGAPSEMGTPGVQSSLREDTVDFSPYCKTGVVAYSSPFKAQNAPLACVPEVESICKSPPTSEVLGQGDVEPSAEVGSKFAAGPASAIYSSPVSEVGSTRESALCNDSAEKPVDSLSEWLDGDSSEMGTPDIQSALTEDIVDLSPNCRGAVKLMDVDSLMKEVVSHILPDAILNSPADPTAADLNGRPSTNEYHVRRKSWQDAGEQTVTEIVENISRSHRHSLSAEANLLSVRGSVVEKVKLFTELAEVKGATLGLAESSAPGSASKECHEAEVVEDPKEATPGTESAIDTPVETQSAVEPPTETESAVDTPVGTETVVEFSVETESATGIPVVKDSTVVQSEGSKVPLATPLRVPTKERPMKGDTVPLPILATPSAATPCEPASVGILRARHRRSSSVGNMTPGGPFDMTGECSPFGDSSSSSPSGQSSSAKSKRVSRGYKEVTPRMNLPKPSWKAIVEREMKGSKLKDILAAELPEESSPLAEYVQSQMENQNRDPESGSTGAKEKDANSTCSPARPVRKMARSSSMKKPPAKEEQQEGAAETRTAQKHKKQNEGEQELESGTNGCPTPGSAVRRSARIQKKVQSRRNMLFKEEFVYMK